MPNSGNISDATARALDRIEVRPPYFALDDIEEMGAGYVRATVPPAPPTSPEVGAIEAAQVARHLAILGSCAAALSRDDEARHHYLAIEAHYVRVPGSPESPITEPLRAHAVASWQDKRTARAVATLSTQGGQRLNVLEVTYAAMTSRMLTRLYPALDPNEVGDTISSGRPLRADDLDDIENGVRVDWGPVPVDVCAGHFPDLPAAPVAIVMGHLCRTAGLGLARRLGRDLTHRIEGGHVAASALARAGQHLALEATYAGATGPDEHAMHGMATADGEVIGKVDVILSVADLGSD